MTGMSRLSDAASAYLRSASHQPVDWYLWGPEAFARAKELNRPILLDIGAVWCHWCHVIDRESYENEDTADIINELYVPVKVDRDERPDVDARYQQAVAALTGQGGWPLTGFLTPDGDLFWGGTYFPPEDRYGRPGFPRILREVAKFYGENPDDAVKQGQQIREALRGSASTNPGGDIGDDLIAGAIESIRGEYDAQNGGFGSQPKFPHPSAVDLLIRRYDMTGESELLDIARHTLQAMGRGGVYDQLGGGFHRYSVDAKWIVPHFEKMLYDNAGLLRSYAWAAAVTGDASLRATAVGIVEWVDGLLSDRQNGGFYSSQDADIGLDDDGDYWTWTVDEARAVLTVEEFAVAQRYYDIYEQGEMHENPAKNVLFLSQDAGTIADDLGIPLADAERLIDSASEKLLAARGERKQPYIDTTIYVNWNGMMIQAYLDAARLLGLESCRDFALTTLDRLLGEGVDDEGAMVHVLGSPDVPGTLDDQTQIACACLGAYQATGDDRYLTYARSLADVMRAGYWDAEEHGFRDVRSTGSEVPFLDAPVKPIQDSPTASANGTAIQFYEALGRITEDERYSRVAEETACAFSGVAANLGLFGSAYFIGADHVLNPPPVAVIVGSRASAATRAMRERLLATPRWGAIVVTHDPSEAANEDLPEAVRGMLDACDQDAGPHVFVCAGGSCSRPANDPDEAVATLMSAGNA